MSIPLPIWATVGIPANLNFSRQLKENSYFEISFAVLSAISLILIPISLYLFKNAFFGLVHLSQKSFLDVPNIKLNQAKFVIIFFGISIFFWSLTFVNSAIGLAFTKFQPPDFIFLPQSPSPNDITNYIMYFMQQIYIGPNFQLSWFLFSFWATSLEILNCVVYALICQRIILLTEQEDSIPYKFVVILLGCRFFYLLFLHFLGQAFVLLYSLAINYLFIFIEVCLVWNMGLRLVKELSNNNDLKMDKLLNTSAFFFVVLFIFLFYWLILLLKYVVYCITASKIFIVIYGFESLPDSSVPILNLTYIWLSVINIIFPTGYVIYYAASILF